MRRGGIDDPKKTWMRTGKEYYTAVASDAMGDRMGFVTPKGRACFYAESYRISH